MRSRVPADEVLAMFEEGVDAFCAEAARLDDDGWAWPACGDWTDDPARPSRPRGRRLVPRLARPSRSRRRLARVPDRGFDARTVRDQADMAATDALDGPQATERFRERAVAYAGRLVDHWDLPYGYPRGTVTAGLHAGMAAVEWHVHTWDIARSAGRDHVPSRPDRLFLAAADCQAAVTSGLKGTAINTLAPLGARRDPWRELLKRLGRA